MQACVSTVDAKFCIKGQLAMSNDEIQVLVSCSDGGNQPASLRLAKAVLASVLQAASPPKRGSPGSRAPGTGSPQTGSLPN